MGKKVLISIAVFWLSTGVAFAKIALPKIVDDKFLAFMGNEAADQRLKLAELKALSKQNPDDCQLYMTISLGSDLAGEYEEELKYLLLEEQCHPRDYPDLPVVWNNIARAYLLLNKPDDAKPWMAKGLVQGEDDYYVLQNKMSFFMAKKDWVEAGHALRKLDEKSGKDEDMYYQWFIDLVHEGYSTDELIKIFRGFLKANPDSSHAKRALALAIRGVSADKFSKTCPRAINFLEKSFQEHPQDWLTAKTLAASYQLWFLADKNKAHLDKAYFWIEETERLHPQGHGIDYLASRILSYQGKYKEAIIRAEKVLVQQPDDEAVKDLLSWAYNNIAYEVYTDGGDLAQALVWVDRALKLSEKRQEYPLETRASILYKLGRVDEAWESIKKAYAIAPEQADVKRTYEVISKAMAGR